MQKEELRNEHLLKANFTGITIQDEADAENSLPATENIFADILRNLTQHNERLFYIYVFTGIIVTTVIITLIRSFIFFNVNDEIISIQIRLININSFDT